VKFLELKKQIQQKVGLELDQFRVSRENLKVKLELKNMTATLEECRLMDGTKLVIERGAPLKEGEHKVIYCQIFTFARL
jgi:hypothetical protein